MEKIRVGVVGCGSIGSEICKAIDSDEASGLDLGMELEFLIDTNPANIDRLCKTLTKTPDILKSDNTGLDRVLDTVDLVIECASQAAGREFIIPALKKGKEVMILSVEAVKYFPENVNVAASLSIAGIGSEATKVKIVADPSAKKNVHEIVVKGEFGKFFVSVENEPSITNPKTSYLAALSAIATLKSISYPIRVGT